jgi:hypothetical protein
MREVASVIGHTISRGLKLLEALFWFSVGLLLAWLSWRISAWPDGKVMQIGQAGQTLGELRNLFIALLVAAVLLAVYGLGQIRQWFRPASNRSQTDA